MRLYLVRHAHAGTRSAWDGPDLDRPLTPKGRAQSAAIAAELAGAGISRLVSSPYTRCVETLVPLGEQLGLDVGTDGRLAEGAGGMAGLELAATLRKGGDAAVLCSHGDVIPEMLRLLQHDGTLFKDPLVWPKASAWVVTADGDTGWTKARYLPPPGR
jgi:phosphohistidine phosphatase SixA